MSLILLILAFLVGVLIVNWFINRNESTGW